MATWQAKTSNNKYLPLFFDTEGISSSALLVSGLWNIQTRSLGGCCDNVSLIKNGEGDYAIDGLQGARGLLSLMTLSASTQAYSNFGAFAKYNWSVYREVKGDTFGGSDMHCLRKILHPISDICLVPYVTCKKFTDEMLAGTTQATTGSSQTMLLSQYLTGMTGGQHYYEAYPHVYGLSFDVYCRVGDGPNDFGTDAAHTHRVRIASHGSALNEIRDPNNNALTVVPVTSMRVLNCPNYKLSNSTMMKVDGAGELQLMITGAQNRWSYDSFGERSAGLWVNERGLIDMSVTDTDNISPSLGGNNLWASWNFNSDIINRVYTQPGSSATNYTFFSFIDGSINQGANVRGLVNMLGFMWADNTSAAVTARPGDGLDSTHVPKRSGGSATMLGMPTDEDYNGEDDSDIEEYETKHDDGEDPDPDPDPDPTVTPPVGPPVDPTKDEDSAGGGGNTESIKEPEQTNDINDGNISHVPDVSGTKKYVLSRNDISSLVNWLNTTYEPTDSDLYKDFKGANPIEYIVSCKWYPFEPSSSGNPKLYVGPKDTGITVYGFNDYGVRVLHLGGVTITPKYNSWLDYEPYTTLSLYVPFCGTVDLDTKIWMGHTLNVYLAVDYNTGSCAAMLLRDGTLTSTIDGVCGIDVQLYGKNQGDYQNAVYQAQFSAKQAKINETKTLIHGLTNPFGFSPSQVVEPMQTYQSASYDAMMPGSGIAQQMGASQAGLSAGASYVGMLMSGAGNLLTNMKSYEQAHAVKQAAEWNVSHIAPHVSGAGSQDPFLQLAHPMFCRLYIRRAQMISGFNIGTYRATVGYSCMRTGRVGDFRGRIVCSGVWKTDGNLLGAEVELIKAKLMKGVFVTNPE